MARSRQLLDAFTVTFDDIETFRTIRATLSELTCLRTALSISEGADAFAPVLAEPERRTYQRWALADRAETASSLAEDLLGLAEAGLYPHADLIWERLAIVVASAETIAAGAPLLGDKWLPTLLERTAEPTSNSHRPVPVLPAPHWDNVHGPSSWFAVAQTRLTDALLACWPTTAVPEQSIEERLSGFGWLPQRYTDGWFLRRGDERVQLTDGQLLTWRQQTAHHART